MPESFTKKSAIPASTAEVFDWHERAGAFMRLQPPWERVELLEFEGIRDGQKAVLRVWAPWKRKWVAMHHGFVPGVQFCDRQEEGPFARWDHAHRVEPDPGNGGETAVMNDDVRYEMPFGPLGMIAHGVFAREKIEQMFAHRHAVLREDHERRNRLAEHAGGLDTLKVAMTGGSGFVGSLLTPLLTTRGHAVKPVRRPAEGIGWNTGDLAGADAVVHLAGEPIAQRWSERAKKRIRESRLEGTRVLAEALTRLPQKPKVLVSASAVGFYGARGDELLDEDSAGGSGFLAEVAAGWEAATRAASDAGIRVVHPRIGVVLDPRGGALQRMLPIFAAGVGGRLGHGGQWFPWISSFDLCDVLARCLVDPSLRGPINAVAPEPVTNAVFTKTLGRVLKRPAVLPAPGFALRAAFGEMADAALLGGARVVPSRLQQAGFRWRHPDLEAALRALLGKRRL
ncbi:TIGR01777 family oxidoreductase [Phycisphaera mikurensis]|uniref:TIGR01777 family protein n=1 Tax=Phycisphaera mikurensis (strain NBRC 102666 / KCTC 22515 / FYK2301M01) TaxID=1142394 RepID=I0IEZ7_PHYMF|nr:TIGR01777 family oxidoreductase [Phycisphaera mikurensis]MBB6441629.1 hypothetical protein [Phycisphaera mikurensis]BAM03835.1 hypothetical protein PSMK_16760 [Phycisphaera mikurensis NBRC 102666]